MESNFPSLVNAHRLSALQITLFAVCFLVAALDGFDVALMGFLAPAIRKGLHLGAPELASVFGAGQFGSVAGALIIGPMADRFGRKRMMVIATLWFALMTIRSAYAPDLASLALWRFLTGFGLGGALPCATALTAEYCPDRKKASLTTMMFCGFTLGSAVGGFITAWAEPLVGWRMVILGAGVAPLLIVPVALGLVPESVDYLQRSGNNARAIDRIAARIGGVAGWSAHAAAVPRGAGSILRDLFTARPTGAILLLWLTSFITLSIVYLLTSWMPLLLTAQGFSMQQASLATAMFQVGGTIGAIVLGVLMDRFRPSRVLAVSFALVGVFVVLIGQVPARHAILPLLIFLAGATVSGGQVGLMAYAAGWYPARVRATGVSWTNACGRIGSIVGSLAGGALLGLGLGYSAILMLLAIPAMLAAGAIALQGGRRAQGIVHPR